MLTIRSFIQGKDEEVWLKIFNAAYKEYDDFRPSTMEDMEKFEKSPNFDATGRFIAEWNGEPVGVDDSNRRKPSSYTKKLGSKLLKRT